MPRLLRYPGQALFYILAMALTGYFAASPAYRQFPDNQAQIKLSFRHGGARVEECRTLTPGEIAKLPAKERRPNTCDRARLPIAVTLLVDGHAVYDEVLPPTGLAGGGPSETYQKFAVSAGPHVIEAKLRNGSRAEGFDYENRVEVDLKPWQNLAIDFAAEKGGFQFR